MATLRDTNPHAPRAGMAGKDRTDLSPELSADMRPGIPDEAAGVFKSIRRIVRSIDLRSREVARAVGLTIPQIVVLQAAHDMGEVTTRAISERSDLSSATVVTILDKLEAKGLVERYRSSDDRRIVHTRVTERGREVLGSAPPMLHDDFRQRFAALPPEKRAALLAAMTQVADMMDTKGFDAASMLVVGERLG